MKTIGIIGSRRRNSLEDFEATLVAFCTVREYRESSADFNTTVRLVSGGCPQGGDHFAQLISAATGIELIEHLPDRSKLDKALLLTNPKAAYARINYARNTLIARDSDILIACVAPDRKGGTEDTIKKFAKQFCNSEAELIRSGTLVLV